MPPPGLPICDRESADALRWSPITQIFPAGTVTSNLVVLGGFPG